ncbi:hypothetical protein C8R44DRAFT_990592 [Mycena epipterygia]|nr:hypothetical protein C8R44DRAFT_990592 [Mycena epipterygia]
MLEVAHTHLIFGNISVIVLIKKPATIILREQATFDDNVTRRREPRCVHSQREPLPYSHIASTWNLSMAHEAVGMHDSIIYQANGFARIRGTGISGLEEATSNPFAGADGQLAFAVTSSVAFAIVIWEYASLLPYEISLYQKPVWGTVPPYAFLSLRYGGILATLPLLFLSTTTSSNCQAAASLSQAGVILVITSSAVIFTFRTALLWGNSCTLRGALGVVLALMGTCWIAVATQYKAVSGHTAPFGSNCRILPTPMWAMPLANASSTTFFITTLVLTLLKMRFHHPRDSVVASNIYRANLGYLIGITLTAAIALVLQSLSPPSSALALGTASAATVLTLAFGTRAFRNFALASVIEAERTHGLPYPSTSPIISPANEIRYAHPAPPPSVPSRPRTAESTNSTTPLNPYTSFPSPPNSYTNHSALGSPSSKSSKSPSSLSPLRRGAMPAVPEAPKSGWSDS